MFLKYTVKADSISFKCTGLEETDELIAKVFNEFLQNISIEKKNFFHGYRLCENEITEIMDIATVLEKADNLIYPYHTFLHLREARIRSNHLYRVCEATIYYFEDKVKWTDFLASSLNAVSNDEIKKLIRKGKLEACFMSVDGGADFWFECNKSYEGQVLQFFEKLANVGYEIKKVPRL